MNQLVKETVARTRIEERGSSRENNVKHLHVKTKAELKEAMCVAQHEQMDFVLDSDNKCTGHGKTGVALTLTGSDGACTHFGSNFVLASDLPTFSKRSLDDLLSFGCRY
ncbi:hypothetical protein JHK85_006081 [Glycine max]|nr:hypothetical protein JHK85_006081 [Glycine max]